MKTCLLLTCVVLTSCSCSGSGKSVADDAPPPPKGDATGGGSDAPPLEGDPGGFVTYIDDGTVYRIEAKSGATPVNVSAALDSLDAGEDESPAVSRNGAWMTITTTRFASDCADWSCLARVKGDLSSGDSVFTGGEPVRPEGRAAISGDGKLIVYPAQGGPHEHDLYAIRLSGATWGAPALLTSDSSQSYNDIPVLNEAGDKLLFDCGPVPYGQNGTGVCEVGVDGSGFRRIIDPADNPLGGGGDFLSHHGDYGPDGSIVFEADWASEQIWMLKAGAAQPVQINSRFSNDNSPCALPGGYIASLWLGRDGGQGFHELKIMAPDGSESAVLTPDVDIDDVGISCHAAPN